jgi:hypothetical protein
VHIITTRTPTLKEQRLTAGGTRPDLASYGCLAIFFAAVPGLLLGKLGSWLGGFISTDASIYGKWIGWSVAAVVFAFALVSFIPHERRRRLRVSQDLQAQIVQEIHVTNSRAFEVGLINDNEPIIVFDIGGNNILFLQGQWLRDSETYGAVVSEDDSYDEVFNGLPEPYSFPSTDFTVTRLPHSGDVIGIRVAGKYLVPETVVEALKPEYEFGNSELFEGSLEELAAVLANEHARRHAN